MVSIFGRKREGEASSKGKDMLRGINPLHKYKKITQLGYNWLVATYVTYCIKQLTAAPSNNLKDLCKVNEMHLKRAKNLK